MSEDMKPIASEVENNVEQPVVMNPEAETAPVEEVIDYSNKGLKELVDLFQELLDKGDVQQLYKYAEGIKAAFYKTLKKEKIAAGFQPVETAVAQQAEEAAESAAEAVAEAASEAEAVKEGEEVSVNPFAEIERFQGSLRSVQDRQGQICSGTQPEEGRELRSQEQDHR